ncbi:9572_t:CDS:2, partial [Scutellospora calospora]
TSENDKLHRKNQKLNMQIMSENDKFYRIITAICSLKEKYIIWPCGNYREEVNKGFEKFGLPIVIGAIDGSHILLIEILSKINKDVYLSRKHRYALHLQGIVNHKGHFIFYQISWSVLVHDAKAFKNSYIYENNSLFIEDEDYLVGDSAYPLLQWLITLFKDLQGLDIQQQKYFNTIHSKTRVVIKQAFGRLKTRFPFLRDMRLKDTKKGTDIIDIALILHNFEQNNENNNFELEEQDNEDNNSELEIDNTE